VEVSGSAIAAMQCAKQPGVVTPVIRVLRDWHELNAREAKVHDVLKLPLGRLKGALGCEGPDVELVDEVGVPSGDCPGLPAP
jgi:hypothetical protein